MSTWIGLALGGFLGTEIRLFFLALREEDKFDIVWHLAWLIVAAMAVYRYEQLS